ncbi:MAG: hypothetical protein GVY20_14075 [Bacteroidetes bacterium]|jgi:hypothetical protein|nr:hypothetical protein [Bacteroidota bacterium]
MKIKKKFMKIIFVIVLGILSGMTLLPSIMAPNMAYAMHCNNEECLGYECKDNPDGGTHCIETGDTPNDCVMDACDSHGGGGMDPLPAPN